MQFHIKCPAQRQKGLKKEKFSEQTLVDLKTCHNLHYSLRSQLPCHPEHFCLVIKTVKNLNFLLNFFKILKNNFEFQALT